MKNEGTNPQNPGNEKSDEKSESKFLTYQEKEIRKKGISKGAWITGIIALVILIAFGIISHSRYTTQKKDQASQIEMQKKGFEEQLTARDAEINGWMSTFDEIESDLKTIKEKENLLSVKSAGSEMSKDKKQQVLADFKYINKLMDQNRAKIAALNEQLRKSGNSIKGLQIRIASLEASLKDSENQMSELKSSLANKDIQIGELNTRLTGLQNTIVQQEAKITGQTGELNKAYIASGTYRDLKDKGIVVKEGGFLGLGRKEVLARNFSDSSFKQIDLSSTKTIPVNSKVARLITDHPANSYKMVKENDKIAYIQIEDPSLFWKISKYAVVETRK